MGALFQFDKMLPTPEPEAKGKLKSKRQVEVFTHGNKLFLRIGAVNSQNSGDNCYTVQLSRSDANELVSSINAGIEYIKL